MSSIEFVKVLLRGVGQILFQKNAFSGFLFLIGIFYNSYWNAIVALFGCTISTLTAIYSKYDNEDIKDGLYGYNGALVGIFIFVFFEINIITCTALVLCAMASSTTMHYLKKFLPPFTFPFVFISWISYLVLNTIHTPFSSLIPVTVEDSNIHILSASLNSFGQVMFQENIFTGFLFALAIFIHSRKAFIYGLLSVVISISCAILLQISTKDINIGLMGYNGILCAIALIDKRIFTTITLILMAVILSLLIQIGMVKIDLIPLTAPFVFSTWIALLFKKSIKLFQGTNIITS
ncbi:MAG: urea transporter [Chitinophagales bacterium]|nr:urea transporter [Chitinophagales bacterium]